MCNKSNMDYLLTGLTLMAIVITKVYANDDADDDPCLQLMDPELIDNMCCNSLEAFVAFDDASDECFKDKSEELACEAFQCILRKNDMLKDGKVDEEGAKKFFDKMQETVPNEKAVIDKMRNECLDGKYELYQQADVCPAIKFYICLYVNVLMGCTSWKKDATCTKLAEDAEKCQASFVNK